ncbi:SpoIIE family protein phosphatase [Anaerobacillus sp. HL2]|nr:SpoIIE family protein phosphatase [Anaerobacillus sp. HL2]
MTKSYMRFENAFFKFDSSSTLIMMTDGIAEQTSNENRMFDVNKLEEILNTIRLLSQCLLVNRYKIVYINFQVVEKTLTTM